MTVNLNSSIWAENKVSQFWLHSKAKHIHLSVFSDKSAMLVHCSGTMELI